MTESIFSESDRKTPDPFCVTAGGCRPLSPVKISVFLLFLMRKLVKYIRQPSFSANFKYLICLIYENEPHYPEHWQYKPRNRIANCIRFYEI